MDRVYFDTSFFIGLLENQHNRQAEAKKILEFEVANDRFTSQLTLNEFLIGVYDDFKDDPDCNEKIEEVETRIRSIARVVAMDDEIMKKAALLQSQYGTIHKHPKPKEPRDRGFRWDALHLATAEIWQCDRIYAWDGKWEKLPTQIKSELCGTVIAPAVCPGLPFSEVSEEKEEVASDVRPAPGGGVIPAASNVPLPPSAQSPASAPALTSPPEPSLPSDLPDAPKQQQQPESGPPPPLPAVGPPTPSKEPPSEKLGS